MLTNKQITKIKEDYFYGNIDTSELSPEEYDYYYNELAVAHEENVEVSFLYFDFTGYVFVQGNKQITYDRKRKIIDNIYQIKNYFYCAIGDNLEQKILSKLSGEKVVYTNLNAGSILSAFLIKNKLKLNSISELDYEKLTKLFINLTGKIEEQNSRMGKKTPEQLMKWSFFNNKSLTLFRENTKLIEKENKKIPPVILAVLYWFYISNNL